MFLLLFLKNEKQKKRFSKQNKHEETRYKTQMDGIGLYWVCGASIDKSPKKYDPQTIGGTVLSSLWRIYL
jgi:hypothetical protein